MNCEQLLDKLLAAFYTQDNSLAWGYMDDVTLHELVGEGIITEKEERYLYNRFKQLYD